MIECTETGNVRIFFRHARGSKSSAQTVLDSLQAENLDTGEIEPLQWRRADREFPSLNFHDSWSSNI